MFTRKLRMNSAPPSRALRPVAPARTGVRAGPRTDVQHVAHATAPSARFPFGHGAFTAFTSPGHTVRAVMPATALATGSTAEPLRVANLELAASGMQLLVDGAELELTAREYQVLAALIERRNRVVPRGELYAAVWRRRMAYRDRSV